MQPTRMRPAVSRFRKTSSILAAAFLATLTIVCGQAPDILRFGIPAPGTGPQSGALLGSSVAVDGNYTVVGAPSDDVGAADSGVVKVFDTATGALLHVIPNPSPANSDNFGAAVAISGTKVVVGAPLDDTGATNAGAAYFYDLSAAAPTVPVATLNNPTPGPSDTFGAAVAISGTRVVVGVPLANFSVSEQVISDAGRVHVYDFSGGNPTGPVATLNNPAPAGNDNFGTSVAISGTRVVVGAYRDDAAGTDTGTVYVYDLASASAGIPVLTLTNPVPRAGDNFGWALAVSETRIVVGAYAADVVSNDTGIAYVYDVASATPALPVMTLYNPTPAPGDHFGWSVALSGTRAVIGAYSDNSIEADSWSAYVYDLSGATPGVPMSVLTNPSAGSGDFFGRSVAAAGSWIVVGASSDDTTALNSGSAYVFEQPSETPETPVSVLRSVGPASGNIFGKSAAISGDWLIVGAPWENTGAVDSGSVYVYHLSGAAPVVPVFTIHNPNPAPVDLFGSSVAISGTRVVVGAGERAYVFDLASAAPTTPLFTLSKPAPAFGDLFGSAVAISGTRVVVGAYQDDTGATNAGSAYVFDLGSATPTVPSAVLNNPSPATSDLFGYSVAISGTRVIVGAHGDNTGASDAGSAYLYDLASAVPSEPINTFNHPVAAANAYFGTAVAIAGTRILVGAPGDIASVGVGRAYAYDLASPTPTLPICVFSNPSPATGDSFGESVGISGTRVVIGALFDDTGAGDAGAAYLYDLVSATPDVPIATIVNPDPALSDNFGDAVAIDGANIVIGSPNDDKAMTNQGFVYVFGPDMVTQKPALISPANFSVTSRPVQVSFHLPEGALHGSVKLVFQSETISRVLTLTALRESQGSHTFAFGPWNPTLSPSIASGESIPDGAYYVTLSYQDELGNPIAESAAHYVQIDVTYPAIYLYSEIYEATSAAGAMVSYVAGAFDDGTGVASSSFTPPSGSIFPIDDSVVTVTANDFAGNMSFGEYTVRVQDTTAPTVEDTFSPLTLPAGTPLPDYTSQAIATDAVGVVSVTQEPAPGAILAPGLVLVTVTALDAAGNAGNVSFTVDVRPMTAESTALLISGTGMMPSAELPVGAVWRSFGVPAVNAAGDVAFKAKWGAGTRCGEGVWVIRGSDGVLEPVVEHGFRPASLSSAFVGLRDPIIASNANVVVPGTLAGTGFGSNSGAMLLSSAFLRLHKQMILFGGYPADTFSSAIGSIQGVELGDGGQAFVATLAPNRGTPRPTAATSRVALLSSSFYGATVLVRQGQEMAGSTLLRFSVPLRGGMSPGQGRRWASLEEGEPKGLGMTGEFADGSSAIFVVDETGAIEIVSSTRSTGPGQPDLGESVFPTTFRRYGPPTWGDRFTAPAFAAVLDNGTGGVFQIDEQTHKAVALQIVGDELSPRLDIRVKNVKDPVLSPDGTRVAWPAMLAGRGITVGNDRAIFVKDGDNAPVVLAQSGRQAADCPVGALYHGFSSLAMSQQGVLLLGSLRVGRGGVTAASDGCLWAQSTTGELRLVLREGQTLIGRTVKTFNVLKAVAGTPGVTRAFNDHGEVVSLVTFTDGSTVIAKTKLP